MHPLTGWLTILTRAKQMKSLKRNERITLRQVRRIYHWFRSVQLYFIISKLILSVHVIYQKCVIFIFQIWIFDEMRDSHYVSKIGLISSALSKLACGGLVRQVPHFVQPCPWGWIFHYKIVTPGWIFHYEIFTPQGVTFSYGGWLFHYEIFTPGWIFNMK